MLALSENWGEDGRAKASGGVNHMHSWILDDCVDIHQQETSAFNTLKP